jgi:hypothetical protein
VALAQSDEPRLRVEQCYSHCGGGTLDGTVKPRLIELTATVLAQARPACRRWLSALATRSPPRRSIPDLGLRSGFLHNIPYHREIMAATGLERRKAIEASDLGTVAAPGRLVVVKGSSVDIAVERDSDVRSRRRLPTKAILRVRAWTPCLPSAGSAARCRRVSGMLKPAL